MAVPSDFAGLEVHYQYDTGYWQDSARTTAATTIGDPIGAWDDQSGNARHATQATAGNRPTISSVTRTVRMARSSSQFLDLPNFLTGFTVGEIFMLLRTEVDPASAANYFCRFGSNASDNDHYPWTDGVIYNGFGSTVRKTVGNVSPELSYYHVLHIRSKASAWDMWINGVNVFSTATNTVGWTTAPTIGKSIAATTWDGRIAELFMYSQERSGTERTDLLAYLAGVEASFPAAPHRVTQNVLDVGSTGSMARVTQALLDVGSAGSMARVSHVTLDIGVPFGNKARNFIPAII